MVQERDADAGLVQRIADLTFADPRSVRRELAGQRVAGRVGERIRLALAALRSGSAHDERSVELVEPSPALRAAANAAISVRAVQAGIRPDGIGSHGLKEAAHELRVEPATLLSAASGDPLPADQLRALERQLLSREGDR